MRYTFRRSFTQLLTAGCIVALTTSIPAVSLTEREELDALMARYDLEPDGPVKESLALRIDAAAHQN